jgi:hypothetical protein
VRIAHQAQLTAGRTRYIEPGIANPQKEKPQQNGMPNLPKERNAKSDFTKVRKAKSHGEKLGKKESKKTQIPTLISWLLTSNLLAPTTITKMMILRWEGPVNSRAKGCRGEREWRDMLREAGFLKARRGQQFSGGSDSPDVVCEELPTIHFEVKRVEAGNPYNWHDQATADAGSKTPVGINRCNLEFMLHLVE